MRKFGLWRLIADKRLIISTGEFIPYSVYCEPPNENELVCRLVRRYMRLHKLRNTETYIDLCREVCKGSHWMVLKAAQNKIVPSYHLKLRFESGKDAEIKRPRYKPKKVLSRLENMQYARSLRLAASCWICRKNHKTVNWKFMKKIPAVKGIRKINGNYGNRYAHVCLGCWNKWNALARRGNEAVQIHHLVKSTKRALKNVYK